MQALCHHKLRAYGVAVRLLEAVRSADVRDGTLRDHAMRSAKSACLNAAEGAGRVSRRDKAQAFTIASGDAREPPAAVEIALAAGDAKSEALGAVLEHADHFVAMMTALIR